MEAGTAKPDTRRDLARRVLSTSRAVAKRVGASAWPLVEQAARLGYDRSLDIEWDDVWGPQHDRALDAVSGLGVDDREHLRILGAATSARKLHAIVRRQGEVLAVVSLRRRPHFWEPVSAQCIPGTPIACVPEQLGNVLNGLGVEIRLGSLYADPTPLRPQQSYPFPRYGADLTSDWESYWPVRGGMNYREARKKTKDLQTRIDHPGDLEWTIRRWAAMWRDDPSGEAVACDDRVRLWSELQAAGVVHSVTLADAGEPVAGCVHYCVGDVVKFECTGRDHRYDKQRVGSRVLDVSFQWAADAGYRTMDLGGGLGTNYKHWWAPVYATSYVANFRPPLIEAIRRGAFKARSFRTRVAGLRSGPPSGAAEQHGAG